TVMDMDRRRISRVKIQRLPTIAQSWRSAWDGSRQRRLRAHKRGTASYGDAHRKGAAREMIRYIGLRLLLAIPALWLILTMVFLLAHIVPGDPAAQMLGE